MLSLDATFAAMREADSFDQTTNVTTGKLFLNYLSPKFKQLSAREFLCNRRNENYKTLKMYMQTEGLCLNSQIT